MPEPFPFERGVSVAAARGQFCFAITSIDRIRTRLPGTFANFVSTLENLRLLVGFPLDLHRHPPARGHDDAGAGRSQNRRVDPARCAALAARRPGHLEVPPRKHLSSVSSRETGSRSRRSSPRWLVLGHGRGRVGGETRERRWSCRNSRRDLRGDSGTHPLPRGAPIRARARGRRDRRRRRRRWPRAVRRLPLSLIHI